MKILSLAIFLIAAISYANVQDNIQNQALNACGINSSNPLSDNSLKCFCKEIEKSKDPNSLLQSHCKSYLKTTRNQKLQMAALFVNVAGVEMCAGACIGNLEFITACNCVSFLDGALSLAASADTYIHEQTSETIGSLAVDSIMTAAGIRDLSMCFNKTKSKNVQVHPQVN